MDTLISMRRQAMSGPLEFDEETSRAVEAVYSTADVVEQRATVLRALELRQGERVLDLGCGPGFLAAEMAEAVGEGGLVHGVDLSPSMLQIAGRRELGPRAAPLELSSQEVAALAFPDARFDVAVSTQVYEYVEDMPAALAEARRVLAPGGRLLVLDTDWDSIVWRSSDDELTMRVLRAWDEHLAHRDLPRYLPELLAAAGFTLARCAVVPVLNIGYEPETYSAGIVELIADFVAGRQDVSADDARRWRDDLRGLGRKYFFSLNRYLFLATR
jgi:arsenite methyltransferase